MASVRMLYEAMEASRSFCSFYGNLNIHVLVTVITYPHFDWSCLECVVELHNTLGLSPTVPKEP
jgi:hypothetical protein